MTDLEFDLMESINLQGLDNSQYLFFKDIESTSHYFGSNTDMKLEGKYVAIYVGAIGECESQVFRENYKPYLKIQDLYGEEIYIYKLD